MIPTNLFVDNLASEADTDGTHQTKLDHRDK